MVAAHPFPDPPVAYLEVFVERIWVNTAEAPSGCKLESVELPVLRLSFDYPGQRVPCDQPELDPLVEPLARAGAPPGAQRDWEAEHAFRRELESYGAVELSCLEHQVEPALDTRAHYLLAADRDVQAYTAFYARALPALRRNGAQVEVASDFPYRVAEPPTGWYLELEAREERVDWFDCELGVEVEGERVCLLPALLDLLEKQPQDGALEQLKIPGDRAVQLVDGRYVRLPKPLLASVLDVLRLLYRPRPSSAALEVSRFHARPLDELIGALGSSERPVEVGPEARRLLELASPLLELSDQVDTADPPGLRAKLRPYQADGVLWMRRIAAAGSGGVLADDMGLGKTLQTIAHLCWLHAPGTLPELEARQSLVVVPTSLLGNWQRELSRFAPHLEVLVWHGASRQTLSGALPRAQVVVTTYALLTRDEERWSGQLYRAVVLDEAQAIKNVRGQARRAACQLEAHHRLCISGTPVENHLGDLWSLFDFLMPGFLGSARDFQAKYRQPIEQDGDAGQLLALRRLVEPFVLRRRKDQVATELPLKTQVVRRVTLGPEQRKLYESVRVAAHSDVRRTIRQKGIAQSSLAILDALMKLRQACCDPRLLRDTLGRECRQSAKCEAFFELIAELLEQKRRALVFSQFTSMLDLLRQGLDERGIDSLLLTGGSRDRQALVDAFEAGQADVFLISLKAGGTGLNLTSADTVIHYDPWWNPAAQAQATDRAHRIGQKRPVFVYQLIVEGSVEERMLGLQHSKQRLSDGLVGEEALTLDEPAVDELLSPLRSGS